MKAVVISGGSRVSKERALAELDGADLVVCADKGAEYAEFYGITPDVIVGDMDSIDPTGLARFKKSIVITAPPEKDYVDTELAVNKALESGADEISIICATGLRSDHAIANIRLLLSIHEKGATGKIVDDENIITLCTGEMLFSDKKGTTISIISMCGETTGITLEGFHYPLYRKNADLSWTTGISNVIIEEHARISIDKGCLLVFEILN